MPIYYNLRYLITMRIPSLQDGLHQFILSTDAPVCVNLGQILLFLHCVKSKEEISAFNTVIVLAIKWKIL